MILKVNIKEVKWVWCSIIHVHDMLKRALLLRWLYCSGCRKKYLDFRIIW